MFWSVLFSVDNRCFLDDLISAFPSADTAAFVAFAFVFTMMLAFLSAGSHCCCFDSSGILECKYCYFGHDACCFYNSGILESRYGCFAISSAYHHSFIPHSSDNLEYMWIYMYVYIYTHIRRYTYTCACIHIHICRQGERERETYTGLELVCGMCLCALVCLRVCMRAFVCVPLAADQHKLLSRASHIVIAYCSLL